LNKICAITCGNVGILIKIAQLLAEMLDFDKDFEQNAPKGRKL
jgi:hypothetical protein